MTGKGTCSYTTIEVAELAAWEGLAAPCFTQDQSSRVVPQCTVTEG